MIDVDCDGGDELKKIDEECISNNHDEHCHEGHKHPTNSLTGLEEALEELKRYEDDESIEYRTCHNPIPNPEPQNQPPEPPIHTVDPLSAYFNPAPMQPTPTTVQTSIQGHANAVYTIATSPGNDFTVYSFWVIFMVHLYIFRRKFKKSGRRTDANNIDPCSKDNANINAFCWNITI